MSFRSMSIARVLHLVVLPVLLLLAACPNPMLSSTTGALTLKLGDGVSAKTLTPPLSMVIASYSVSGTGPSGATFSADGTVGQTLTVSALAVGGWTVTVDALNSGGAVIGSATGAVTIVQDQTATLSLTVVPLPGNGDLSVTVKWTAADVSSPSLGASLTSTNAQSSPLSFSVVGSEATASTTLAAGYYMLTFQVMDGARLVTGAMDVVRIVSGQTTSGVYDFTSLGPAGTGHLQVLVTPQMADPLSVSIAGVPSVVLPESPLSATAYAGPPGTVAYIWSLNGQLTEPVTWLPSWNSGGGTLAPGHYRLDVAALTLDGRRAGSATATFQVSGGAAVASPSFSPPPGTYSTDQDVTITSAAPGSTVYYTMATGGMIPVDPTTASSPYTGPIPVSGVGTTVTISAIVDVPGVGTSRVATVMYSIVSGYTLVVDAGPGGSVTPSGPVAVAPGASTTITATPFNGYAFRSWTVVSGQGVIIGKEVSALTDVTLTSGDAEIQAVFDPFQLQLTVQQAAGGSATPNGSYLVGYGTPTPISAAPDAGHLFITWHIINGSASFGNAADADTTVTLTSGGATIAPTFEAVPLNLTVRSGGNGTVSPGGTTQVSPGSITTIIATPGAGYEFSGWTVESGSGVTLMDPSAPTTTIVLTSSDAVVQADFSHLLYSLDVQQANGGDATPATTVVAASGVPTPVNATPADGYSFVKWQVLMGSPAFGNIDDPSTTVTLTTGDAWIAPVFAGNPVSLTVQGSGNGDVAPSGVETVAVGSSTPISASPHTGYNFVGWIVISGQAVVGNSGAVSTTVMITSGTDAVVQATFTPKMYNLTLAASSGGHVTPSGTIQVPYGVAVPITASPNGGHPFIIWAVLGPAAVQDPSSPSTTVTVSGDASVTAEFSP